MSDKSRHPKTLRLKKKLNLLSWIYEKNRWRAARISIHLFRKEIMLSAMHIWRILFKNKINPVVKRRKKFDHERYNKEVPRDRIQLNATKIWNKTYQFTAVYNFTRSKVIRVYIDKKARKSTTLFLGEILDTFYFPITAYSNRLGYYFFNYYFQYELHEHFIKYNPIKQSSLHLNDKVERTQQTGQYEFWSLVDLSDPDLDLNVLAIE